MPNCLVAQVPHQIVAAGPVQLGYCWKEEAQ